VCSPKVDNCLVDTDGVVVHITWVSSRTSKTLPSRVHRRAKRWAYVFWRLWFMQRLSMARSRLVFSPLPHRNCVIGFKLCYRTHGLNIGRGMDSHPGTTAHSQQSHQTLLAIIKAYLLARPSTLSLSEYSEQPTN